MSGAMWLIAFAAAGLMAQTAPVPPDNWGVLFNEGKQAYVKQQYAESIAKLRAASQASAGERGQIEILRFLAAVHRETGDPGAAEQVLATAAERCAAVEADSIRLAFILEETAAVQRAQNHVEQALASFDRAVRIRSALPDSSRAELARSLAAAAMLRLKSGDNEKATEGLEQAVREWDASSPGDPQALPAIEALATTYRDHARYQEAAPLFRRALRMREAASGPAGAEVISAVDSLAYVEFGLKNFAEAEALYRRLAALWEANAGPEHPMLALTYDKMAEFYAFQQRYDEAEKCALTALALRTRMHLGSLNQTGRILLMEAKLQEAEDLYKRSVEIGDLVDAPDDAMDPVLRIYAKLLRELKRDGEAEKLEARVKDALIRKGDREGRIPSPVAPPKK